MKKPTKQVVIDNVKTLMQKNGDTTYSLADRSGLAQSTVVNILSGKHKISVESADIIATAYGLEGWHLLMRNLPAELLSSKKLERLCQRYIASTEESRSYIDAVAERESKYKNQPE